MVKTKNSKAFSFMDVISWNRLKVESKALKKIAMFFTLRESR
jgi:hypothetical protein